MKKQKETVYSKNEQHDPYSEISVRESNEYPGPIQTQRSDIFLLRKWQIRSQTQNRRMKHALQGALSEFDRLSVTLKLPKSVRNSSSELIRTAWENGLIRGASSIICMIGAVVYASCRIQKIPRKLSRVASEVGITEKELMRCYRKLAFDISLKIPLHNPITIIPIISQRIQAPDEVQKIAVKILKIANRYDLIAGKNPWGLAAAAIYLASLFSDYRVNQRVVADAANVTEVTVRNRYKELREIYEKDMTLTA